MKTFRSTLPALLAIGLLGAGSANASQYSFSFLSSDQAYDVHGIVTTSDVLNAIGGYDITGVTGLVQGTAGGGVIDSLVANPSPPNLATTGGFNYDNVAYAGSATTPFLDTYGALFTTAANGISAAGTWNLYSTGGATYGLYSYTGFNGGVAAYTGTLTVAAVPEPSSWVMLVSGALCLGAVVRRRQSEVG